MKNNYVDVPATRGDTVFRNNMFTGSALADFMIGYATSVQLSNFHEVHQRQHAYSFFVQDDYRATDRLTLNLGLRYDFVTPQMDAENRVANFDPATGQLYYATDGSIEDRALVAPDRNNFGPRLGIVYKANTATVISGGYGIYYNLVERMGSEDQLSLNPPGLRNISITAPAGSTTPALILRNGFPPNYLDVGNINYRTLLLRTAQQDGRSSMFHQFAIGARAPGLDELRRIGGRGRLARPQHHAAAKSESAGQRERRAAISKLRRDPVPGPRGREPVSRARSLPRKAIQQGPQLSRVVHDRRPARQHAGASVGCFATAAEHQRSRSMGSAGRQRHPASLCGQLHCGPAARPATRFCATGSSPAS